MFGETAHGTGDNAVFERWFFPGYNCLPDVEFVLCSAQTVVDCLNCVKHSHSPAGMKLRSISYLNVPNSFVLVIQSKFV